MSKDENRDKPGGATASGQSPDTQRLTIQQTLDLALREHTAGRLSKAEGMYRQILKAEPDNPVALHLLGVIAHQSGANDVARDLIAKAIALKPDYAEAHNNLGNVLLELGRLEDSVACCREAIKLNPDYAEAHNNLGNAFHELRRLDDAVASYEKAIAIEQDPEVYLNLGSAYQQLDRLDDAVATYEKALALMPGFAEAHFNLGTALESQEKFESAIDNFETAGTSAARLQAMGCLYTLGRYDDLFQTIEKFAEVDKTDINIASMSVFVSYQVDRENPHPFCKNPLDFIRVGSIGDSAQEIDDLTNEVMEQLKDVPSMRKPRVAIMSGYQTETDLFDDPKGGLARLERIVKAEIEDYYSEFKSKKCVYMDLWPAELHLKGWVVHLFKGGHQDDHTHPVGWLSGVIYLKLPETYEGDEGCIEFRLDGYDYPLLRDDGPTFRHRPEKGDIILFPASAIHRTIPLITDEQRTCLAFNLLPAPAG